LTTRQTNLLQETSDGRQYPKVEAIGEYRIKVGDELRVNISMPSDFTKTESLYRLFTGNSSLYDGNSKLRSLAVSPEGNIYFPYIGNIYVLDKTTLDVQIELEGKINNEILVEKGCLVSVSLDNRYFSVIGESGVGRYSIAKEQLTIYQALSQSKDIHPYGDRSRIKVIRQTQSGTVIRTFDLKTMAIVNSDYYYIQPNDVIYIQPLKRQFWGINSFGSLFAVITTLSSLGITVYNVIHNFRQP
jgi:polysaccharide export outer membrane protein